MSKFHKILMFLRIPGEGGGKHPPCPFPLRTPMDTISTNLVSSGKVRSGVMILWYNHGRPQNKLEHLLFPNGSFWIINSISISTLWNKKTKSPIRLKTTCLWFLKLRLTNNQYLRVLLYTCSIIFITFQPKQVLRSTILSSTIKIAWLWLRFGLRSTKSKKE